MTFRSGQPVVCVNSAYTNLLGDRKELTRGRIYTIAACVPICCEARSNLCTIPHSDGCVHLVEVRRPEPCRLCGLEIPFAASRFRPVQHRETDISELQKLCDPTREVVR